MAIAAPAPSLSIGRIEDPVTIKESSALFQEAGHPVAESTLRRWAKEEDLYSVRARGTTWYSDSDLLELHKRRVLDT